MTAPKDAPARLVGLNAAQGMALGLAIAAAEAAGEAAALGGYKPTAEEVARLDRALSQAAIAMVLLVDDWAATTDEQLEAAARDLGVRVLRAVLGPPPMAN